LLASNGARHRIGDIRLGTFVDSEPDGQPIDQDDVLPPGAPDDEDGVIFLGAGPPGGPYTLPYIAGQNGAVQITISTTRVTAGTGYLHGWFDWNQDGDWNDAHENAFSGFAVPLAPGVFTMDFEVPVDALPAPPGVTWARFRLDDQNLNTVDGLAFNGEVEDYREAVVCQQLVIELVPASGCEPLTVQLNASVSGGTPPYQYYWDLGDGTSSTLQRPVHTYDAGTYTVTLTVTDEYGCSATRREPGLITVHGLPTPRFTADPSIGFAPLTVQFSDASIPADAPIAEWHWDLGDGTTSIQQDPSHTYTEPGAYTVTLTVTDSFGCSNIVSQPNLVVAGEMQLSKYRPHGEICATDVFWYYICVTNTSEGPLSAINPVISDVLPHGIAPYSVLVSEPGVFDGVNTVTWDLDSMAPGDHTCVWIRAQTYLSAAGQHITNRAWLEADNLPEPVVATDVAYVYRPPCPPQRTVVPPPTSTPTSRPTRTRTPTSTPTAMATARPSTGGIVTCLWNDLDGDGFRDGHEVGLPGLGIEVQDDQGQFVDACSTDAAGCCTIIGLPPGLYTVIGGAAADTFFTTARSVEVEVLAGQLSDVSFGSRQLHRLHLPLIIK
jgi:PKD repeat protein